MQHAMTQLCDFKSQLFNLNLSVHNFLAELHASTGRGRAGAKFSGAVHLKEEVAGLYRVWDQAHHATVAGIARAEDTLAKLRMFEAEAVQLRTLLAGDTRGRGTSGLRARAGGWSGDSGISDADSADWVTDSDERLAKLRLIAASLRRQLPPESASLQLIDRTLQSASAQLEDLHGSLPGPGLSNNNNNKTKLKPKLKRVKSEVASGGGGGGGEPGGVGVVRARGGAGRLGRVVGVVQLVLVLVAGLCWLCCPACCDQHNTMLLLPQLTYVNGPPPI